MCTYVTTDEKLNESQLSAESGLFYNIWFGVIFAHKKYFGSFRNSWKINAIETNLLKVIDLVKCFPLLI